MSLGGCSTSRIDEDYAISVVKQKLSLSGEFSAQRLSGGASGADLFLVTDGTRKYVIRFMKNKTPYELAREVHNLQVASRGGYGPQVYFADASQRLLIMQYLSGERVTAEDFRSGPSQTALAVLLKKIRGGEPFKSGCPDFFTKIEEGIDKAKGQFGSSVPLEPLQGFVAKIYRSLLPYLSFSPCHNDLHPGNLIFVKGEGSWKIYAIDYEDAGQCDPFVDLATVSVLIGSHSSSLVSAYLGRPPSPEEEAKLYLMEQLVLAKWSLDCLGRLSSVGSDMALYASAESIRFDLLISDLINGKLDINNPEVNAQCLKSLLTVFFEHVESEEFNNYSQLLNKRESALSR